jgi:hypothetical protein
MMSSGMTKETENNKKRSILGSSSEHQASNKKRRSDEVSNILSSITPTDYAHAAFKANGCDIQQAQTKADEKFIAVKALMLQQYTNDVVDAVRRNDLQKIKALHATGQLTTNACNQFGESIMHIACHRGHFELVKYMLNEMHLSLQHKDDYNRTPLHDACWTTSPQYELVNFLLEKEPSHLLLRDLRGYAPLDYVRKNDNGKWLRFLWERKHKLVC